MSCSSHVILYVYHMNYHGISFLLIFKPLLSDDQKLSYKAVNKGVQYRYYNFYLLKQLRRILQFRVDYYIWPNTLEYLQSILNKVTVISGLYG